MNAYQKQLIDSKIHYLAAEEKEVQRCIRSLKEQVNNQEEKLRNIQAEKAALEE
ncbi:hypothetical protein [Bacillus infantis]|uniref:hypothetical protein n=1 Tax=Bacillus infantis TaxID=324767 RepID=UPI003CECCA9A